MPEPLSLIVLAALAAAILLVAIVLVVRARKRRAALPPKAETGALPPRAEQLPLAPTEAMREGEREAARLRDARETLKAQAEQARQESDRAREQELNKEAYRRKKELEAVEKAQKKLSAEQQAQAEAERRAEEEAAAAVKTAELAEVQRKKIEAVSGRTLAEGLDKTKHGFMARLGQLWGGDKQVDEKTLAELEDVLFTADIGVRTAQGLLELAREKVKRRDVSNGDALKAALRAEVARILALPGAGAIPAGQVKPLVIMVVGVNGAGKTTTIGKLAAQYARAGKSVVLGAGDTFRAAAGEQLEIWAERAGVPIVRGLESSDPGAVIFDAIKKGVAEGADVVLCDTAGRLHTKQPLMEELKKVKRVMEKALAGAPQETLLVLDSTNGQNAIVQARQFHEAMGVTGLALTKLDGTAKGGVIIGICDELKIPVRYVGVGEGIEDLRAFDPAAFVAALFE